MMSSDVALSGAGIEHSDGSRVFCLTLRSICPYYHRLLTVHLYRYYTHIALPE